MQKDRATNTPDLPQSLSQCSEDQPPYDGYRHITNSGQIVINTGTEKTEQHFMYLCEYVLSVPEHKKQRDQRKPDLGRIPSDITQNRYQLIRSFLQPGRNFVLKGGRVTNTLGNIRPASFPAMATSGYIQAVLAGLPLCVN